MLTTRNIHAIIKTSNKGKRKVVMSVGGILGTIAGIVIVLVFFRKPLEEKKAKNQEALDAYKAKKAKENEPKPVEEEEPTDTVKPVKPMKLHGTNSDTDK